MHTVISRTRLYILSLLSLALCLTAMSAQAVPSFARQTGMPCQSCHTVFPELTAFGRSFKLNGYTMTSLPQVKGKDLSLNKAIPISVMLQTGATHLNKATSGTQNNSVEFPQELSIYYAGALTKHMGAFLQVTYDHTSDNGFNFDMADFRYANRGTFGGKTMVYGVTLNNMPGMEDVWHTTPSFRFPYAAPDTETAGIPGPGADVLANGLMGAGLGAYALLDNQWYGMVSFYRTSRQNSQTVPNINGSINGLAPYVRLAWQKNLSNQGYLEIGTYAVQASFIGGMMSDGAYANGMVGLVSASDKYTDLALDATYQQPMGNSNQLTIHAVYIHEKQALDSSASTNPDNTLKQTRIDGNYEFGHTGKLTLGYFSTVGNGYTMTSTTAGSYSDNGNAGFIAEADYLPWENTKFSIQYTNYTKFDGASSNYDGAGRNASDNNTLYFNAWWMW